MENTVAPGKIGLFWSGSLGRRAAELHEALLAEVFPAVRTFISTRITAGDSWFESIQEEIGQTRVGLFFLTPDSLESPWRPYECGHLAARAGDSRAVIPVRVGVAQSLVDARAPYLQPHHAAEFGTSFAFQMLSLAVASQLGDARPTGELQTSAGTAWARHSDETAALFTAVKQAVPNPYEGTVRYARSINQSNFNMPGIFEVVESELFLVGINHAFVLNVQHDPRNLVALARRMLERGATRRARFLISDLWNPSVAACYRALVHDPVAQRELESFSAVYRTPSSPDYIQSVLTRHLGEDSVQRLVVERLIDIRTYPTILDTFWFVDGRTGRGKAQLSPANAAGGTDRPFFLCGEDAQSHEEPAIFTYYYNLADTAFSVARRLWPV